MLDTWFAPHCWFAPTVFAQSHCPNLIVYGSFGREIDTTPYIRTSNCRIAGITVAADKNNIHFNFIEAQSVCRQLGLMVAPESKVEAAWKHGFETCSFGWVAEGYTVISRITPNEKCGQNNTGIRTWRMHLDRKARVYCYNSSDTWINSCIPEESTVALTDSSTEMNSTLTASFQDTSTGVDTTQLQQTQKPSKYRIICVTETLPPEPIPEKENLLFTDKRTAFKNEGVPFGGNSHTYWLFSSSQLENSL
uniref:Lymphatic vessel endothelial hyaluronan receptor 1 n=1 Tax=Pseudonaja textilis TaxID=8673 RepID=A0A670XNQ5_PSETE